MLGLRKKAEHDHNYSSYWAGPGLVRMVCCRCGWVSINLGERPATLELDHDLAVDCFAWMKVETV